MVKQRSLIESLMLDEHEDDDVDEQELHITRGECPTPDANGLRVCPWVSCRHHLALDVTRSRHFGERLLLHPFLIDASGDLVLDSRAPMCALDVADLGPLSLEAIGSILCSSREYVHQVERQALRKLVDDVRLVEFKAHESTREASAKTRRSATVIDNDPQSWLEVAHRLRSQVDARRSRTITSHVKITRCLLAQMREHPQGRQTRATPDAASFTREQWRELLLHQRVAMVRHHCRLTLRTVSRVTHIKQHIIKSVEAGRINIDAQAARSLLAAYGLTRADIESDEAPQTKYLRMRRATSSF